MKSNSLREKAATLRDSGYSYAMINNSLGISKSTLSNWFRDRKFVPNKEVLSRIQNGPIKSGEKSHNLRIAETERLRVLGAKELGRMTKRDLWLVGIGIYIGEGSKSHEMVRVINSDPRVIKLAIKWFKEMCGLSTKNMVAEIHLYPDSNIQECLSFWRKITGLPKKNFRKTQIDRRTNKSALRKNKLPHGVAHITIVSRSDPEKGVRLHRKISGWIHGVFSQTN
ncbi:MAG: hypothetical protein Q7S36_01115 [Candidatus Liptonbacteria bacterium]|nr:hypothetical protein [Candidatus Liptonbacteria bacterium]